ncbi:Prevent host death protein, Phd antitoxin [hydrothermal vent metagenome]|uniref:Prevent host death protein, Phd antitoxin n=1 Tax=hydrothermal vent metagenome TaxID=652676 RepID=A0A3B0Y8U0_9ZZZZ
MKVVSANEAKTQFGDMLLKVQRNPIQINRNGKPVAVLLSADEYNDIESLKLSLLQARAARAKDDIASDNLQDGESFFNELESGEHD